MTTTITDPRFRTPHTVPTRWEADPVLTIGQLATYAGTTVRAVRHYHSVGLLAEPDRDHSGYRRYDAAALVELIKVRTLAEAGVPLARVAELLHADADELATAVADIDARLHEEIRERQRHRERIARLAAGDHLVLPPDVVGLLDRLRTLGVDERIVDAERDGWIPLVAHHPERVPEWVARKHDQLSDPVLCEFYLALGDAFSWPEDDPRLAGLADRLAARFARMADEHGDTYLDGVPMDPPLVTVMDARARDTTPTARRLAELLRERGWTGWTKLGRLDRGDV